MKPSSLTMLSFIVSCCLLTSCSSTSSKKSTPEADPDVVLSRIDNMKERPSWLKESEPFKVEGGMVSVLGVATIPGDDRVEAAYRIAENNAKASVSSAIDQRLDFIFQNAEEGTTSGTVQSRYIGAEASKIVTSALHLKYRYWEKVASTNDLGRRITQYKVFAIVQMPESDFKNAILDVAKKRNGHGGLSKDFANKVDDHWNQFVSEGAASSAPAPTPASSSDKR